MVHVEGQTEGRFVEDVLRPWLLECGYWDVRAKIIGKPGRFGGITSWEAAKRDFLKQLKSDPTCVVTTMVDYYGLPTDRDREWPGRSHAPRLPPGERAPYVEAEIQKEILAEFGDVRRFIPHLLVHEFEALLFSDCDAFARAISIPDLATSFRSIREEFNTPEDINDSPQSAPHKRILRLVPRYQKPLFGTRAILAIGLDRIRAECHHFNGWLTRLERLVAQPAR